MKISAAALIRGSDEEQSATTYEMEKITKKSVNRHSLTKTD
jgi:hypothetical protein